MHVTMVASIWYATAEGNKRRVSSANSPWTLPKPPNNNRHPIPPPLNSPVNQLKKNPTQIKVRNQHSNSQPTITTRISMREASGGCGFGIRFDETIRRSVYNPSLHYELVIEEGTVNEYMRRNVDPKTKFSIPNQKPNFPFQMKGQ